MSENFESKFEKTTSPEFEENAEHMLEHCKTFEKPDSAWPDLERFAHLQG
ncbi:MAG: hypothetical protein KW788_00665 [Candidatus Doudnabacteria bacterium]|nr:hypothetical protein [Candidatus Doudnabacteria bacterium]